MALALLEDAETAEQRADVLTDAELEIDALNDLIEDVLLASRLRGGVSVPRNRSLVNVLELGTRLADRHQAQLLEGRGEAWIEGDVRLIERAVGNLLANAVTHGAPPVELAIRTGHDRVEVHVLDQARASPTWIERVFSSHFFASRVTAKATGGLGLSLVDGIARHRREGLLYSPSRRRYPVSCRFRLPKFLPKNQTGEALPTRHTT